MRKKLLIVFMIVSIGTLVFAGAVYDRADAPLSVELAGVFSTTEEPVVENKPEPIPEEPVSVSEELLPVSKELPWNLMLVNQTHLLGEEFVPECGTLSNGYEVDARIVDAVDTMLSDAKAAGHSVWCTSGYRSYALQEELFQNKVYLSCKSLPTALHQWPSAELPDSAIPFPWLSDYLKEWHC